MFNVGILTISDSGYAGNREDKSGPKIQEIIKEKSGKVEYYQVIPDDKSEIKKHILKVTDDLTLDLLFTTGGTGIAPTDVTPDATKEILDKEIPGIAEAIRAGSLKKTKKAMLSRGVSGIRNKTLIINLPGSPKAVSECLEIVLPVIDHAIELINDEVSNCARK